MSIYDRWKEDEEMQKTCGCGIEILEMPCLTCKKRFDNSLDSCEEYEMIPWEIRVVDEKCELFESIEK